MDVADSRRHSGFARSFLRFRPLAGIYCQAPSGSALEVRSAWVLAQPLCRPICRPPLLRLLPGGYAGKGRSEADDRTRCFHSALKLAHI